MSSPSSPWTLLQLESAYRQGYLEALLERPPRSPVHEVLAASWEAGWLDGSERLRQLQTQAAPRKAQPLQVQISRSVRQLAKV
ncbi:ribosome modulation factor [Pseudomonas denitrificans (nom. rej.)]|nr:ribosome modulation factor [Pseudomonas denitrificans (nom. rej.)]